MASTTLATTLTSGIMWDFRQDTGTIDSGLIAVDSNRLSQTQRLANAAADMVWHNHNTLTVGTLDIDLAGVLRDTFGNVLTFVKVMGIYVKNLNTVAGDILKIGGDANGLVNWVASATDIVQINAGGCLLVWNPIGYTVTAATGDILQLEAVAHDITYDIVIVGKSS